MSAQRLHQASMRSWAAALLLGSFVEMQTRHKVDMWGITRKDLP